MLTARRFTTIPTKDCRDRLADALANRRPIARGEPHRGAVVAVQSALADLNRGYLLPAEVDGFFGPRTYGAVEAFQRDYGLAADGVVGRQTMTQLDTLYGDDVVRRPVGRSIHVGVDRLDPGHYGSEFPLASCVNDARKMCEIAGGIGYDAVTLENEEATVSNFTGFMRTAISDLFAGDSLLVTFSGHGSQLPNTSADEEADMMDETLCFFDRMLLDDEFYALLGQFREGVQVHAVFDSCHSGTVAKVITVETQREVYFETKSTTLKALYQVKAVASVDGIPEEEEPTGQPIARSSLSKALDGEKPKLAKPPKPKKALDKDVAALFADLYVDVTTGAPKSIDFFSPIYDANRDLYDAIKNVVGPKENQQLSCSVITLSACQDSQTTPAGPVYSFFTYNLMSAWGAGGFDGSYRQFHQRLTSASLNANRDDVTPAINVYGTNRANARLYDRPFMF